MGHDYPATDAVVSIEQAVRQFADDVPLMLCVCSTDGSACYLNRRWRQFTGNPAEYHTLDDWLTLVHPEDRPQFLQWWAHRRSTNEEVSLDYRLRRHDGSHRWFELRARVRRDEASQLVRWLCVHTDIQERLDARDALLQSEQRFRGLYHSAPVSIWLEDWSVALRMLRDLGLASHEQAVDYLLERPCVLDQVIRAVRVVDVNEWALTVFRAQRKEQLVGSLDWLFTTPAGRASFARKAVTMVRGEQRFNEDMELTALDGSVLYVQSSAFMSSSREGNELAIVSRVDVTALQQANDRLSAQQRLLGHTHSMAKVGGWTLDLNTMQPGWTPEVARIHALPPDVQVDVERAVSYYREDARPIITEAVQQAIEHGVAYDLELPFIDAKGVLKWVRTQGIPVRENGVTVALEGTFQDVTDRKLAQLQLQALNEGLEQMVAERTAELEHSRHHLQATLDAIPAIVVYLDRDLHVQYANLAAASNLDMSVQELSGKSYLELFGYEHYRARKQYFDGAFKGALQSFEDRMATPLDAHTRIGQVFFIPDARDGVVNGIFVMLFDITNLKNTEAALLAANQELEAFSYAVAHDLRAPLRALNGFSNALQEDCADSLDETARDYADEIAHASQKMSALLDGLLTLSRSTQGDMNRELVDVTQLAERIMQDLQQVDPQRVVAWNIAPGLKATGDPRMIELVLQNLLGNAWKYTQQVASPMISVEWIERDGQGWFCVSDNGAGFDMAHADRLFKPFQRLHRQDEFVGIGIGLATVQRIVLRHGGQIVVEAAPGKGARFYFTLAPHAVVVPASMS